MEEKETNSLIYKNCSRIKDRGLTSNPNGIIPKLLYKQYKQTNIEFQAEQVWHGHTSVLTAGLLASLCRELELLWHRSLPTAWCREGSSSSRTSQVPKCVPALSIFTVWHQVHLSALCTWKSLLPSYLKLCGYSVMSTTDWLNSINSSSPVVRKLVQGAWTKLSQQNSEYFLLPSKVPKSHQ